MPGKTFCPFKTIPINPVDPMCSPQDATILNPARNRRGDLVSAPAPKKISAAKLCGTLPDILFRV